MKFIRNIVCILLIITLLLLSLNMVMASSDIIVKVDNQQIVFDVPPQLINNRTMVPLRAIFEALGATVYWNNDTQTVTSTKGSTTINLTINDPIMYVNGTSIVLDTPACLVNGRTLVPVRAVSEAFGTSVDWVGDENTVLITTQKIYLEKISFNNSNDTVSVGESKDLPIIVQPQNAMAENLSWSSSDTSVVTVYNGRITGVKEGNAVIVCENDRGINGECKITVTPAPTKATSFGVNVNGKYISPNGTIELEVGDKVKLLPQFIPNDASVNTEITWQYSGSSEYLTLSSDGELTANGITSTAPLDYALIRPYLPDGAEVLFKVVIKPGVRSGTITYYPKTNIPTYTSVTGVSLSSENPSIVSTIYKYPYIETSNSKYSYMEYYIDYLLNNGWKEVYGLGTGTVALANKDHTILVSYVAIFDEEVWISVSN